jgi:hypothetical protein
MDITSKEHIAHEAFIRRASELEMPFMLKGSYISRQYFPEGVARYPADLDWVYLHYLEDPVLASAKFDEWMIAVTELELNAIIFSRGFIVHRSQSRFYLEYPPLILPLSLNDPGKLKITKVHFPVFNNTV